MSSKPNITPDELHDQITDQALSELLGEQSPPDLSERILAAASDAKVDADRSMPVPVETAKKPGFRWKPYMTAACLLVGLGTATILILPSVQSAKAPSTPVASGDESYDAPDHRNQVLPSPYYLSDDVELAEEISEREDLSASRFHGIGEEVDELDVKLHDFDGVKSTSPSFHRPDVSLGEVPTGTVGDSRAIVDSYSDAQLPGSPTVTGSVDLKRRGGQGLSRDEEVLRRVTSTDPLRQGNIELYEDSSRPEATGGDRYGSIVENPFRPVLKSPLSTFSIDVDTASYANVRRYLLRGHSLPPAAAVRIEELVNYFDYDYATPRGEHPFAAHVEVAGCPWQPEHRLVRVALKGKEIDQKERPESNLVFLLDVSGSMSDADKLPLLKQGMQMLTRQLGENDRVAIVVYAGSEGLALPSTRGHRQKEILAALERLQSGGSTNGGAGITLAYKIAQENFIEGGANRVILCTDGDFNVGTTGTEELKKLVAERAKDGVFLSVLGFGRGNLNDEMMESISNRGNGNYSYIDNLTEARKVLVSQMSGTLVTIAKDVKIQIEFNPSQVQSYRLIGYENRILAAKDFNDDKKDAGEIGAGHTVTALYEIVPAGKAVKGKTDPLKYQPNKQVAPEKPEDDKPFGDEISKELLTLKLRYKQPEGRKSKLMEVPVTDNKTPFARSSKDFQFAASVASFGMLLRGSKYRGSSSYSAVEEIASASRGKDRHGYRAEFLDIVRRAKSLER